MRPAAAAECRGNFDEDLTGRRRLPPTRSARVSAGIFAVRCAASGQVWIGQALDLDADSEPRLVLAAGGQSYESRTASRMAAHGADAFSFEPLEALKEEELAVCQGRAVEGARDALADGAEGRGDLAGGATLVRSSWPGLSPAIYVFLAETAKAWMPGTSPGHDGEVGSMPNRRDHFFHQPRDASDVAGRLDRIAQPHHDELAATARSRGAGPKFLMRRRSRGACLSSTRPLASG